MHSRIMDSLKELSALAAARVIDYRWTVCVCMCLESTRLPFHSVIVVVAFLFQVLLKKHTKDLKLVQILFSHRQHRQTYFSQTVHGGVTRYKVTRSTESQDQPIKLNYLTPAWWEWNPVENGLTYSMNCLNIQLGTVKMVLELSIHSFILWTA